jgi:exonuclease SbcD
MMRLSRAGIPTMLLVGNHDLAPAENRAHTLHEFATLDVPHIFVGDKFRLWGPEELGVDAQVLTLPWVTRSRYLARHDLVGQSMDDVHRAILERIQEALESTLEKANSSLPLILTAHASIVGADYGSERLVMLGQDMALGKNFVTDPRLDYVALGHIHKHQCLNDQPPVVYSGSIERIDFGEAREKKGYVIAEVGKGHTEWRFVPLQTRPFLDIPIAINQVDGFMDYLMSRLPATDTVAGAICRLRLEYAHENDPLLDEQAIRDHFAGAFDLRLIKHRVSADRANLSHLVAVETLSPYDTLAFYWGLKKRPQKEIDELLALAAEVLNIHAPTARDDGRPPVSES